MQAVNKEKIDDIRQRLSSAAVKPLHRRSSSSNVTPLSEAEFRRQNPAPHDYESASRFLRKHCDVAIFCREDHDKLRIGFKGQDVDDAKIKTEYTDELALGDSKLWEETYTRAAQKLYKIWFANEVAKY